LHYKLTSFQDDKFLRTQLGVSVVPCNLEHVPKLALCDIMLDWYAQYYKVAHNEASVTISTKTVKPDISGSPIFVGYDRVCGQVRYYGNMGKSICPDIHSSDM
jgi:hypothetical protein